MTLSFTKSADGTESANLGNLGTLEIVLDWEQPASDGGRFGLGKLRDRFNQTDVDVSGILYEGSEAVDFIDPKNRRSALSGRIVHHGDVKRGTGDDGGERITMDLASIRKDDADITAIALTASCTSGDFSKIAGAVCRVYDTTGGERKHLGNVRFSVTGDHTGALLGVVRKDTDGWSFVKAKAYGTATNWRQLAHLARGVVGRA